MKYYGKIDFSSQTFNFTDFDYTNEYILFSELYDVHDVNDKEVMEIRITFDNPTPNNIKIIINYTDNTTNIIDTYINNINQDLDVLFNGNITGYGCLSTNSIYDEQNIRLMNEVNSKENVIFFYRLNSEKNVVTKDLLWVKTLPFSFNNPIKVRDMLLNVKLGVNDMNFNYVYISSLHRFYFVNDMMLTNDYAQLTLHEDILSSWDSLIREQTAYVERNQYNIDSDKVDDLVTFDYDKNKNYIPITPTNDFLYFGVTPLSRSNFVLINVWGVDGN